MCGIFGLHGRKDLDKKDAKLVLAKVKSLGLYNVTRGQHSCGIYINGQIFKGVDKLKVWDNFIEETILPLPEENFNIICHTRQATVGEHNANNAHPFKVNNLIGVHNGVIQDVWKICNDNKISHEGVKVDSHALYLLIDKLGIDVLNKYRGKAALAWTDIKEPHSMYLFHGCSRITSKGQLEEERPMFTMKTPEGIYFSSMPLALDAIRDGADQKVEILPYNIVFKLTNGKFTTSKKDIDRENANVIETFTRSSPVAQRPSTTNSHTGRTYKGSTLLENRSQASLPFSTNVSLIDNPWARVPLIHFETLPPQAQLERGEIQKRVFFWKGRYWKYNNSKDKIPVLLHGEEWLQEKGHLTIEEDPKASTYYFWNGVMLKDAMAMTAIKSEIARSVDTANHWSENKKVNIGFVLSKYSKQAITCLSTEGSLIMEEFKNRWYLNEEWPKGRIGAFTAKFSGRHYLLVDGYLQDISSSVRTDKTLDEAALAKYRDAQKMKDMTNGVKPIAACDDKCSMIPISLRPPIPEHLYAVKDGMEDLSVEESVMTSQLPVSNCKTRDGQDHSSNLIGGEYDADAPNDTSIGQAELPVSLTTVYESVEEAMENLGEIESNTLKEFHKDLHLDTLQSFPSEGELSQSILDTIAIAVKKKVSISVALDGVNPDILAIYYNEALSEFYTAEQSRAETMINDIIPTTGGYVKGFATLDNEDDEFTEEQEDMNQQSDVILEDIGDHLIDLKQFSDELECNTGSPIAVEVAQIVQQGIGNLAGSLIGLARKYDKKDFLGKLCKTVDA